MVKYTHLNRDPGKAMEDLVKKLHASSKGQTTKPTGVKDMGETGDTVWTREDGTEQSTRLIDTNLEEARTAVSELRDVTMPALADELSEAQTDLQAKLDAANKRIDDIVVDGGGAGNFTTYSVNAPSSDGTGEGDQWFQVVNGEVKGQWRWDGAAWQTVTLTDAVIAGIDLSKLVSNGGLSEVVANKMFTDIFTANKITSQEIAAGSITTEKIAAEGIVADVIQGGSFTGETFEGGTFTGGAFKTSASQPGEVLLSDTAADGKPGLRITPSQTSSYSEMPYIGPSSTGARIYGGKTTSGAESSALFDSGGITISRSSSNSSSVVKTYDNYASVKADATVGGVSGAAQAVINAYAAHSSVGTKLQLYASTGASGTGTVEVSPTNVKFESTSGSGTRRIEGTSELVRMYTADSSNNRSVVEAGNGGINLRRVNSANQYSCSVDIGSRTVDMYSVTSSNNYAGRITINTSGVFITGIRSVASSTNARISPDSGEVVMISSSRRYKENIEDWSPDKASVLGLRPRRWTPKAGHGQDEVGAIPAEGHYVGFVAEEVEELGLLELVDYSKDENGNLRPESVNYDRFAAAQQVVLVDHETRIAELEARVKELTNAA